LGPVTNLEQKYNYVNAQQQNITIMVLFLQKTDNPAGG
jgi:hypothetical protein